MLPVRIARQRFVGVRARVAPAATMATAQMAARHTKPEVVRLPTVPATPAARVASDSGD